jgi:hypothetical protein
MIIIQGDNGTILRRTVKDDVGIVNLTNATVVMTLSALGTVYTIAGSVVDAVNGVCDFVLTSEHVSNSGTYSAQCRVEFADGKAFSELIWKFVVERKLGA